MNRWCRNKYALMNVVIERTDWYISESEIGVICGAGSYLADSIM